jgi:ferritin
MHYENTIINSSCLKPYVHYVPIKEDFSDLKEVMEWCLSNESKCKEIIKNANEYAKFFLDEANVINFLQKLISEVTE